MLNALAIFFGLWLASAVGLAWLVGTTAAPSREDPPRLEDDPAVDAWLRGQLARVDTPEGEGR